MTVVVVAYNDAASLDPCVRSLRPVVDAAIILVDNHSDDDTWTIAAALAAELTDVVAIRSERNLGYAGGVNLARAKYPPTEFLAVSNADCTVSGDWITPLVEHLDQYPDIGAASSTVALGDRSTLNAEGLDIHKTGFGFNRHLGRPIEQAATDTCIVPGIQGTAFVVRSSALDAIGGWYAGGFLYHEDVELSWALRLAGFEIAHVPTPPVLHDYRLTMSPEKFFLLERNRLCMLSADLGPLTKAMMIPAFIATETAVWIYAIRKGSTFITAKLRAYRSFLHRRVERRARAEAVRAFRTVSDRDLLAAMSWRYPRSQTTALHHGATSSGRRGNRQMPTS